MSKEELIEWIENLPVQTFTDELKEDIISNIESLEDEKSN
jgi:hypothetical protein